MSDAGKNRTGSQSVPSQDTSENAERTDLRPQAPNETTSQHQNAPELSYCPTSSQRTAETPVVTQPRVTSETSRQPFPLGIPPRPQGRLSQQQQPGSSSSGSLPGWRREALSTNASPSLHSEAQPQPSQFPQIPYIPPLDFTSQARQEHDIPPDPSWQGFEDWADRVFQFLNQNQNPSPSVQNNDVRPSDLVRETTLLPTEQSVTGLTNFSNSSFNPLSGGAPPQFHAHPPTSAFNPTNYASGSFPGQNTQIPLHSPARHGNRHPRIQAPEAVAQLNWDNTIQSLQDAQRVLNDAETGRIELRVEDDDVDTITEADQLAYAQQLFQAMWADVETPRDVDNGAFAASQAEARARCVSWLQAHGARVATARCIQQIAAAITLHKHGLQRKLLRHVKGRYIDSYTRKADMKFSGQFTVETHWKCRERIAQLIEVVRKSNRIAWDVLDADDPEAMAAAPAQLLSRKISNLKTNLLKNQDRLVGQNLRRKDEAAKEAGSQSNIQKQGTKSESTRKRSKSKTKSREGGKTEEQEEKVKRRRKSPKKDDLDSESD